MSDARRSNEHAPALRRAPADGAGVTAPLWLARPLPVGFAALSCGGAVVFVDALPAALLARDLDAGRVEAETLCGVWLDIDAAGALETPVGLRAPCRLTDDQPTHRIEWVDFAGRARVTLVALDGELDRGGGLAHERGADFGSATWQHDGESWWRESVEGADDWHEPTVIRCDALVDPRTWRAHPDHERLRRALVARGVSEDSHGLWCFERKHVPPELRRFRMSDEVLAGVLPKLVDQLLAIDLEHRAVMRACLGNPPPGGSS